MNPLSFYVLPLEINNISQADCKRWDFLEPARCSGVSPGVLVVPRPLQGFSTVFPTDLSPFYRTTLWRPQYTSIYHPTEGRIFTVQGQFFNTFTEFKKGPERVGPTLIPTAGYLILKSKRLCTCTASRGKWGDWSGNFTLLPIAEPLGVDAGPPGCAPDK